MATNKNTTRGEVIERLPNSIYRVRIDSGEILAYLAGRMKLHQITVLLGDKVEVVLDPAGGRATNRIVRRL